MSEKAPTPRPVIVTRKEIERLLGQPKSEAVEALQETAQRTSPLGGPEAMAMVGAILREMQEADAAADSGSVMITAQHEPTSRLQSLIASGEGGELLLNPLPSGGLEAQFDTKDWAGWAQVVWHKLKHLKKHKQLVPTSAIAEPMPDKGRVGLIGDWGTGLYGAPEIRDAVLADADPFMLMIHLGDIYYSGAEKETQERFLDIWPRPSGARHLAINSNHEMYCGGDFYFGLTLPEFGQGASYFALQNAHWTLVGLDVAYIDHAIDDAQVAWLKQILAGAGDRKVILLSHHQLFSSFEGQGTKLRAHPGFAEILKSRRIFAWYWGHEHRCIIYQQPDLESGLLGRCIGHGGMPQSRSKTIGLPQAPGMSAADWRAVTARVEGGVTLAPPGIVLEGENPFIVGEEQKFTPHGYAVLTFDGPHLFEEVRDPKGAVIFRQQLA